MTGNLDLILSLKWELGQHNIYMHPDIQHGARTGSKYVYQYKYTASSHFNKYTIDTVLTNKHSAKTC